MLMTVLIIVLILLLLGAWPGWGHGGWGLGYAPSGLFGIVLLIIIILLLTGQL